MKTKTAQTAAALLLLAAITIYRLCIGFGAHLPWLENFAPVAAVALCGGIYLPRRLAVLVPLGAMLISDILLNWHFDVTLFSGEMASRYVAIAATIGIGFCLRNRASLATVLPASLLGSGIFYLLTNTSSWLAEPGYAKSAAGWVQALTTGLPGYAPTWTFFQSTALSDLLFSALFVLCMTATRSPAAEPAMVGNQAGAQAR